MRRSRLRSALLLFGLAMFGGADGRPAAADVPVSGDFTASRACPAYVSFRRGTNPGDVAVEAGRAYPLIAKNRADATHYRLRIDGASPPERWVEAGCGTLAGEAAAPAQMRAPKAKASSDLLLAISWQPAFCEGHANKAECATQTEARPDARQFSLHGLWPQPRGRMFCNVARDVAADDDAGRWNELPALQLTPATAEALRRVMPGTLSQLDRHEWIKHGTCYGADAETYFRDSIRLVEAINTSTVGALFAARLGRTVSSDELRAAFDASFGEGAGARVTMQCVKDGGRRLIVEVKIGLSGTVPEDLSAAALGDLIRASRIAKPECADGIVDPAGLQ